MTESAPLLSDQLIPHHYNGVERGTSTEEDAEQNGTDSHVQDDSFELLPLMHIVALLSSTFAYGCILTTLFLITLPVECERIERATHTSKSILLGIFVAIAGFTQLVSPLIGRISDTYEPPLLSPSSCLGDTPRYAELGQRLPYYMFGAAFTVTGLWGQMLTSYSALWLRYCFCFFFSMVGLNIQYAMMLALIPDQIPRAQTGTANGILALLLVTGSIFGFALFHLFLQQGGQIESMYGLYASIVILTSLWTASYAHDRDAELSAQRMQHVQREVRRRAVVEENVVEEKTRESSSSLPTATTRKWHVQARRVAKRVVKRAVRKAHQIVLTPTLIVRSMIQPIRKLDWNALLSCYTIDINKHHDFFIVTVSRLFYYCGMSVQTFFLFFLHDIINIRTQPETAVAILAIIGQCSGALTCYPVGIVSDRLWNCQRQPFVYAACAVLTTATLSLVWARTFSDMIFFCIILGAANGVYLTAETSLAVDTLPHELDGDHGSAQLLGIWGVAAFLGSALGPMIGGPLLYLFGQPDTDGALKLSAGDASSEAEYTITGYAVVLSLSAMYFFCSAITLRYLNVAHP
jgi:Major Facilitator Superfamily